MFGRTWRVGRIAGVAIRIDASWTIIFALVTWSLYKWLGDLYPRLGTGPALALAAAASLLFFGSVLTHEMAHAVVARRRGIPVHGITLFLFGGATHAAVEAKGPGAEFTVAAVGPLTSLGLGAAFGLGGMFGDGILPEEVAGTLGYLGIVNVSLAVFNLIPGFPLDGGRVLRSIVWRATGSIDRATRVAAIAGQTVGYLLMAAGLLFVATGLRTTGIWFAAIGWFLAQAARTSYAQQQLQSRLGSATAAEVMSSAEDLVAGDSDLVVPRDAPMTEVLGKLETGKTRRVLVAAQGDEIVGLIGPADVARWLRREDAVEAG